MSPEGEGERRREHKSRKEESPPTRYEDWKIRVLPTPRPFGLPTSAQSEALTAALCSVCAGLAQ